MFEQKNAGHTGGLYRNLEEISDSKATDKHEIKSHNVRPTCFQVPLKGLIFYFLSLYLKHFKAETAAFYAKVSKQW